MASISDGQQEHVSEWDAARSIMEELEFPSRRIGYNNFVIVREAKRGTWRFREVTGVHCSSETTTVGRIDGSTAAPVSIPC